MTDRRWFDCRVKNAPVLYIALEGEAGIAQRKKAYEMQHGRLSSGFRFMLQSLDIRLPAHRAELVRAIRLAGWAGGVVCLDTLNRAAPGMDENDSRSMGEVISAAKAIQAELGGLVLVVHHTGKDATKGLRGHSSLHAALDCAIEVSREGDQRQWSVHKSKEGEDGEAHPFRLEVVEIGTDEDDEPITSCVVIPDDTKTQFRKVLPPKSGNMRVVWEALGELLRLAGDVRPKDAPGRLPIGRPTVTLNCAIEATRERLACDPKRKTERAQQALTGLHAKGLIVIDGGFVWVA
jgi:putative DNA primase/helicase